MTYHPHTPAPRASLAPPDAEPADPADAIYDDPKCHPGFADDPTPFTPVPLKSRHDGWTPARQRRFICALAETGVVREAAAAVGMSVESAYRLRRRPEAQSFRLAWDAALDHAMTRLADALADRALNGVEIPHYHKGELVGTHRRHDNRLGQWLLSMRRPDRYGSRRTRKGVNLADVHAQQLDILLYAMGRGEHVAAPWWQEGRTGPEQARLMRDLATLDAEDAIDALRTDPASGWDEC